MLHFKANLLKRCLSALFKPRILKHKLETICGLDTPKRSLLKHARCIQQRYWISFRPHPILIPGGAHP